MNIDFHKLMKPQQAQHISQHTIQAYNQVALDFANTRVLAWPEAQIFEPYIQKLKGQFPDGITIADIGCANGRMVPWVDKMKVSYIGVEPADSLLSQAKKDFPNHEFRLGALPELPLAEKSVEVCLLNATLHHLPQTVLAPSLADIKRTLKPGGLVLMVNWNLWQPRFWMEHVSFVLGKSFRQIDLGWKDIFIPYESPDKSTYVERFYHGFTLRELKKLADSADFKVLQQNYIYKTDRAHWWSGRNILSIWQKPA